MLLLLLACSSRDPADTEVIDTDPAGDTDSDAPDRACEPDHAWLPDAPEVVEAVHVPDWSFQSWQVDLWLSGNGLGWLTPTSHAVSTYRIRYRTQDRGQVVEATALVSVPVVSSETPMGTVLWHHPTSGFEEGRAPSVGAVEGVAPAIISAARGYVAVAPDYLGLVGWGDPDPNPHPWIVGEPSAIASLDALRAVDAWLPSSAESARVDRGRIVYWGFSEGGFAALSSDRYAPSYAPEYAPVGVIAAVPPVDLVGQVRAGTESLSPASRADALILHLGAEWYGYDGLDEVLQPDVAAALPGEAAASCGAVPSVDGAASVEEIFDPDFMAALQAREPFEPWTCFLERSSFSTHAVPYESDAPVLLVTGEIDTLVPTAPTREAIPAMCAQGYTLQHIDCADLEHGEAPLQTLRDQIGWMDARMRGEPVAEGCAVASPSVCDG
jgi:dienelactone hydrolase